MTRKSAEVICDHTNKNTYKKTEILKTDHLYILTYKGNPVNIRKTNLLSGSPSKYSRICSTSRSTIKRTSDRLNEEFGSNDFSLLKIY